MRNFIKKQLVEITDSMREAHKELDIIIDENQRFLLLQDCQQAAITIGENVEKYTTNCQEIVSLLEMYCEDIYLLSQQINSHDRREKVISINTTILNVKNLIQNIPSHLHVVFFPYKASMWDSLESIWKACSEDARCECYVVPIPYYQRNSVEQKWEFCYEGNQFPKDVPIVSYKEYEMEKERADIAYIHNPYDDYNLVTSVDPSYYSEKIKKHVEKLVYVPYYVTKDSVAKEHKMLPSYKNIDYMILQSEFAKQSCLGYPIYDKIIPLGSPKIDKVIQACNSNVEIPLDWHEVLQGKKIVMLNTSLGCFLNDGEIYLEKIRNICKAIKKQDKVTILWRPHPLLESTIKSMRPHLLNHYQELVQYFKVQQIGVFDQTPDITRAVAIADGYIGEEGSSVINLFGAAGKPIFILDNTIIESFKEEESKRVHVRDMVEIGDTMWMTTNYYNALFSMDKNTREVHFEGRVEGQAKWSIAYPFLKALDNDLYLSPHLASSMVKYNVNSRNFELLSEKTEENLRCHKIMTYRDKIFYLPYRYDAIIEYNTKKNEWIYHTECIQELSNECNTEWEIIWGCIQCEETLWLSSTYTNQILQFNMENGTYRLHEIGNSKNGYSGIASDGEDLWLEEIHNGDVYKWNSISGQFKIYHMPEGFCHWKGSHNRDLVHSDLFDMGKYMVTIPGYSNCMVRLDKVSGKASLLVPDYWKDVKKKNLWYRPDRNLSSIFGKKIDNNTIWVQRIHDDKIGVIQIEDETYEEFYLTLTSENYEQLINNEDGFEKRGKNSAFCRRESRIFTLEGYVKDLTEGRLNNVKVRQLQELSTLSANMDGTCGSKVHEYMMGIML